jgi:hypothetical protein
MSLAGDSLSRLVGGSGGTSKAGDVYPIIEFEKFDLEFECSQCPPLSLMCFKRYHI